MVMPDVPYGTYTPGKRHVGAPSDRLPIVPSVRATGLAQLVGAAEAMLELLEADAKKPIVTTTYKSRLDSGVFLHDIGEIAAQIDAAKTLLFNATGLLDAIGLSGEPFTDAAKAKHKAQCGQIVNLVHTAIESIMFLAGSSAFALDKPICRFWRDIHVGLRHITNIPMLGYEIYGRNRLGVQNISPSGAY
jgi:3-hydroxy-9,10-secoandrosta-1,3,5(10)-triene-9,17-dione monooxygenase